MTKLFCQICGKEVKEGIWELCEEHCNQVRIRKVSEGNT